MPYKTYLARCSLDDDLVFDLSFSFPTGLGQLVWWARGIQESFPSVRLDAFDLMISVWILK
jgi:hypothetical protein